MTMTPESIEAGINAAQLIWGMQLAVHAIEFKPAPDYLRIPNVNFIQGQWRFQFPNGLEASVIRQEGSYGAHSGDFEVAVVWNGDVCLCLDGLTEMDPWGFREAHEVHEILNQIKNYQPTEFQRARHLAEIEAHKNFYKEPSMDASAVPDNLAPSIGAVTMPDSGDAPCLGGDKV